MLPIYLFLLLVQDQTFFKVAFEITTKIDGSMGILYGTGGDDWHIATRGSFDSEQARVANELLHLNHKDAFSWFELDKTYLFEIVYSENRIVVDYGNKRDLILIAVLDTETGRDCNSVKYELESPFFTVEKHLGVGSIEELLSSRWQSRENFEGYVIRWLDNDYRLKVKLEEYLRLHKIMTGVTARRVWEVLAVGDSLDAYLSNTPNEFSDWVLDVAADLFNAYAAIEDESSCTFKMIFNSNRKTFAEQAKSYSYADILFRIYDGKAYADLIWKRIKPAIETPFMKGEDQ